MSKRPQLIVFSGLQCVGKSTIANELSVCMQSPIFSVDPIHSAILSSGLENSFEVGYASYLVAAKMAEENLKSGFTVIIDACNYVHQAHEIWEKLAVECNVSLKVIDCYLEAGLHKKRIKERRRNLPKLSEVTWDKVLKRIEETEEWEIEKLRIDTSDTLSKSIDAIRDYLE